jgi:SAM-dependent methyltransferase
MIGILVGKIMASETAAENEAEAALELQPSDWVLEIAFGPGRALEKIARSLPKGRVAGADHSPEMVRAFERRARDLVQTGRLELRCAEARALPSADAQFDKALAVHTVYFWSLAVQHQHERGASRGECASTVAFGIISIAPFDWIPPARVA